MDKGFDKRCEKHPAPQATTENVFWEKTGWKPGDFEGKLVLDACCGCGRFAAIAARHAKQVYAIDSSPYALAATEKNAPSVKTFMDDLCHIRSIPPASMDLVYSIGVLHHTESIEASFREVANTVKPGGELAIWVYSQPIFDDLLPVHDFM